MSKSLGRQSKEGLTSFFNSNPIQRFTDWYRDDFNPTKPSKGWTDAVQAGNNAIATGSQVPAGYKPGQTSVPVATGAVDASTGVVKSSGNGGNSGNEGDVTPGGSRNVDRSGAKGTQTGPSPADFPSLLQSLQTNHGMRNPYSSIALPSAPTYDPNQLGAATIATGINAGKTVNANDPNFQAYVDGEERIGTTETLITKDGSVEANSENLAATDGARAIQTSLADALQDTDGMRSYMRNLYGGRDAEYDRRGAAFLNGSADSMIALREAELSQGYMRQNGRNFAVDSQGNPTGEFTDEGRNQLRANGYGNANSEEFMGKYQVSAAAAQSQDSKTPPPATTDPAQQFLSGAKNILVENTNVAPFVTDTMRLARTNVTDFASGQLEMGVDGREPLMRSR